MKKSISSRNAGFAVSVDKKCSRRGFLRLLGVGVPSIILCGAAGVSYSQNNSPTNVLSHFFPSVTINSRKDWAWDQPKYHRLTNSHGFSRITIHHEGMAPHTIKEDYAVAHHLNNILAGHLKQDFGDIGYHYMIDFEGRIWEGRSTEYEGAHVASANEANLGVMLMGNFEEQEPSDKQISSMHMMLIALMHRYFIPASQVFGHCDLAPSVCPGKNLYQPHVSKFRDIV